MVLRRVLLVDGNVRLTRVLASLLADEHGFVVVGVAHDLGHALALARSAQPDVVLVSESLRGAAGAGVCAQLREVLPHATLLLWSTTADALPGGVDGLLDRGASFRTLVRTVRAAHAGEAPPVEAAARRPPPAPAAAHPAPADDGRLHLECRTCEVHVALRTADMAAAVAEAREFFHRHADCATAIDLTRTAVAPVVRRLA